MKKKAIIFAVVHLVIALLCLSQSSFTIIPAPADTHIAPTPVFDCLLVGLLAPVILVFILAMWLFITLEDVVPEVYLRHIFWILPVAFTLNSVLYGTLIAWIHTKFRKRKTEPSLGTLPHDPAGRSEVQGRR
jgi:hypothetical protein